MALLTPSLLRKRGSLTKARRYALWVALLGACGEDTPSAGADRAGESVEHGRDAATVADSGAPGPRAGDGGRTEGRRPDASAVSTGADTELCDGIDNDHNGIVDDRDVSADGVCDCLAIATLGGPANVGAGDVFSGWLDARSDLGAQPLAAVTAEELAKYQVLVMQNMSSRELSAAEVEVITDWVKTGGGLLTLTGYTVPPLDPNHVNVALAPFGMQYGTQGILFDLTQLLSGTAPVTNWTQPHPVTEGIMRVGVANGFEIQGDGEVLASERGLNVLMGKQVGEGHVLAWGDEWITINGEWKAHADYQVERLWQNMIKWVTAKTVCQVPIILL
jgi:hypothetical protein